MFYRYHQKWYRKRFDYENIRRKITQKTRQLIDLITPETPEIKKLNGANPSYSIIGKLTFTKIGELTISIPQK